MKQASSAAQSPVQQAAKGEPAGTTPLHLLEALKRLRYAGDDLLLQAKLYQQLIQLEWAQEKQRLQKMVWAMLLAFVCVLCLLLMAGALVLAFNWDSAYRPLIALGVVAFYAAGIVVARRRIRQLSAQGAVAFAATRAEMATDFAFLRSML